MDGSSTNNEKISIKNLLFTKAIPNYTLPIPTDGREFFSCTDCGDRFIIKSSYEYHINRKSLKITYVCRYCNDEKTFLNRCNLLSHIRSHVFKTATINISDIKIEPLPLTYFNCQNEMNCENEVPMPLSNQINQNDNGTENQEQSISNVICIDCKSNIYNSGIFYKDRAKHYMEYTNSLYSCPICLITLFTQCALKAHIRLHLKEPPYYCPECGIHLGNKTILYPYSHDCESFKMMRVTAKLMCMVNNCSKIFHPNESIKHLKSNHLKKVYKCSGCSVACYKISNMLKHFKTHKTKQLRVLEFSQCEMCPGRLVIPSQIDRHLKSHESLSMNDVYPCWTCGATFKLVKSLIHHQIFKHEDMDLQRIFGQISQGPIANVPHILKTRSCYSLSKKCDRCLTNFISRYSFNKHSAAYQGPCNCKKDVSSRPGSFIVCHLCKLRVILDWTMIKKHYATYHKEHKCLDASIVINKLDINQYKKGTISTYKRKKINRQNKSYNGINNSIIPRRSKSETMLHNKFTCNKCDQEYESKQSLETHIIIHKDPFMAFQCMECGESFIAKRSFSTHLLLKHGIDNVNDYIDQKKCYNEGSLHTYAQEPNNTDQNDPVNENQCNICREQFSNSTDFQKHFRVHGMAFLMKNTNMTTGSDKVES